MPCLIVGLLLVVLAAHVIAGDVYRRLAIAGVAYAKTIRVFTFIGTFIAIFFMMVVFFSRFRLMR